MQQPALQSTATLHSIVGRNASTHVRFTLCLSAQSRLSGSKLAPEATRLLAGIADAHRKGLITDEFRGTLKDLVIQGKFKVASDLLRKKQLNETFFGRMQNLFT